MDMGSQARPDGAGIERVTSRLVTVSVQRTLRTSTLCVLQHIYQDLLQMAADNEDGSAWLALAAKSVVRSTQVNKRRSGSCTCWQDCQRIDL
jgi:hypothetical protein